MLDVVMELRQMRLKLNAILMPSTLNRFIVYPTGDENAGTFEPPKPIAPTTKIWHSSLFPFPSGTCLLFAVAIFVYSFNNGM